MGYPRSYQMVRLKVTTFLILGALKGEALALEASSPQPLKSVCSSCTGKTLADVIAPLIPAVVRISVKLDKKVRLQEFAFPNMPPGFFSEGLPKDFFKKFPMHDDNLPSLGYGSGFIIDPAGYIVTNRHVIARASEIYVMLHNQRELKAEVVGQDPRTDIALLKICHNEPLPSLTWGESRQVRVCDTAIAIGTPYGLGGTITLGVISHIGRTANMQLQSQEGYVGIFFQTDAAINPGNSGGPLLNAAGEVIGINTAMCASTGGGYAGLGLSIPGFVAQPIVDQLKSFGRVRRSWLGVHLQEVTSALAEALMLKDITGALVTEVIPGSPAQESGVRPGDVILKVENEVITSREQLVQYIAQLPLNSKISLTLWRKQPGHKKFDRLTLVMRLVEQTLSTVEKVNLVKKHKWGGLEFSDTASGVCVTEVEGGRFQKGFVGSFILEVDSVPVKRCEDVIKKIKEALKAGRKSVLLLIKPSSKSSQQFCASLNLRASSPQGKERLEGEG